MGATEQDSETLSTAMSGLRSLHLHATESMSVRLSSSLNGFNGLASCPGMFQLLPLRDGAEQGGKARNNGGRRGIRREGMGEDVERRGKVMIMTDLEQCLVKVKSE